MITLDLWWMIVLTIVFAALLVVIFILNDVVNTKKILISDLMDYNEILKRRLIYKNDSELLHRLNAAQEETLAWKRKYDELHRRTALHVHRVHKD